MKEYIIPRYRVALIKDGSIASTVSTYSTINSPENAIDILRNLIGDSPVEVFCVLCLDTRNKIIAACRVSEGSLSMTVVHPREVFQRAILSNAASIIIAHNHPSGDSKPSNEDIKITKQLVQAGEIMKIKVFDHIIIGESADYSFSQCGLL